MNWLWFSLYIIGELVVVLLVIYALNRYAVATIPKIIVIGATLSLAFVMTYIIYQNSIARIMYPPSAGVCPDYWQYNGNLCLIPDNGRNVGTFNPDAVVPGYDKRRGGIDFNDAGWSSVGSTAFCGKSRWANTNTIWWDGITNVDTQC
jgi:hypothetical protein